MDLLTSHDWGKVVVRLMNGFITSHDWVDCAYNVISEGGPTTSAEL